MSPWASTIFFSTSWPAVDEFRQQVAIRVSKRSAPRVRVYARISCAHRIVISPGGTPVLPTLPRREFTAARNISTAEEIGSRNPRPRPWLDGRNKAYSKVAAAGIIFAKSAPWVNVPQKFLTAVFCFRLPEDGSGLVCPSKAPGSPERGVVRLAVAAENFVPASCSRTRSGWRGRWAVVDHQSFQFLSIHQVPEVTGPLYNLRRAILIVCRGSGEENERERGCSYGCMPRVTVRCRSPVRCRKERHYPFVQVASSLRVVHDCRRQLSLRSTEP